MIHTQEVSVIYACTKFEWLALFIQYPGMNLKNDQQVGVARVTWPILNFLDPI